MRAQISQVFITVCIFPIILGSPLGLKSENDTGLNPKQIKRNNSISPRPKLVREPSGPLPHGLLYRKRITDVDDRYKNRRTTTNKSEAIGVTEIYIPKSRYLSRGYQPVYIYYVPDSTHESSTKKAPTDGFINTGNGEFNSNLLPEDETKGRSSSEVNASENNEDEITVVQENHLQETSDPESDYDDDEDDEDEYEYENESEYDESEDEYAKNDDDSALSTTNEALHSGHNKVCVHPRSNQNQGFQGKYPNQYYQGQYNNPGYHGYRTNTGYQGYYPSPSNQGLYPDHRYRGQLSNHDYPKNIRDHPSYYPHGYQSPDPYHGNQGPPNRGYQGPHLDNNHVPYRSYQVPPLDNNQRPRGYQVPHRGYQGPHLDNNHVPYPYRGYKAPHLDNNQHPYRGYQGPHYGNDPRGSHPNHGHHGNALNQNEVDPNCNHDNMKIGRGINEPKAVAGSGQDSSLSDAENDNFSSGDENPDYLDTEYDEDSEYDEDEDESEDSSDKLEVPLQNDITFESKEILNDREKIIVKNGENRKAEDLLNSEFLNDESSDSNSGEQNESVRGNNKSGDKNVKVTRRCVKSIENEEIVLHNLTDGTVLNDCTTGTIENAEGNKSGRLLDIFTRTNFSVECTTPKNESGKCKSFVECPIRNIMDNYNLFLQYMCLRGVFVGVCCPDNPVVETSDSDDNSTTGIPLDIQQPSEGCGLAQKTRIVGGTISAPHEWTWMVALMRRNRFFCGGVIINNWYVLTAAHCVLGVNVKDLKVRLGEYNFMERTDHQHDINVAEVKRHAMFVTATFQHDIALLKLKRRIEYSKFIGSICLPETNARSYSDDKATVVGWGTVSFGGSASPILRQVTVPVWDNEDCDSTYFLERIDDSFLCAGSVENGEDACQGDSGGPLMTLNSDSRWEVIGIVSWGRRCGDPTYPGVYTRVTSYLEWISAHAK